MKCLQIHICYLLNKTNDSISYEKITFMRNTVIMLILNDHLIHGSMFQFNDANSNVHITHILSFHAQN